MCSMRLHLSVTTCNLYVDPFCVCACFLRVGCEGGRNREMHIVEFTDVGIFIQQTQMPYQRIKHHLLCSGETAD